MDRADVFRIVGSKFETIISHQISQEPTSKLDVLFTCVRQSEKIIEVAVEIQ